MTLDEARKPSSNLELVRSIYAAWERGDFSSTEWAHPEIEYVHGNGPDAGSWKGLTAMAKSWRDVLGAWEGYRVAVDEYREIDGERVLVFVRVPARGKASGLELRDPDGDGGGEPVAHQRRQGDEVRHLLGPGAGTRRPRPRSRGPSGLS